jgi:hypothetical protein
MINNSRFVLQMLCYEGAKPRYVKAQGEVQRSPV